MSEPTRTDPGRILVVEDDQALRELLTEELTDAGYDIEAAGDAETAMAALRERPAELVVSDLRLPGATGLELLKALNEESSRPGFIMITAFGTVEQAVDALKQGADDFLTKPLKLDHLRISVERVLQRRRLQEEVSRYRKLLGEAGFHGMIGRSSAMRQLFDNIRMVARAGGPALVTGESGTGKELVARAIHAESARGEGPFVAVNCAGIPPELLESELFGHTAHAFTGANQARKGLFAEADGGSLLLDEIGEMPMEMQAKLLRILQDGRIRPIGANQEQQLDVRIIAATNRNLDADVRENRFREDLYFRLETFSINVPPLRERGDDAELLTVHLINEFNLKLQKKVQGISSDALQRIRQHSFPGNVRELSSAIERAVAFCRGDEIGISDLPERLREGTSGGGNPDEAPATGGAAGRLLDAALQQDALPSLNELERQYIELVLKQLDGNKRQAAEALGIGRRTLYRRLGDEENDSDD
ncbi:MAG: sigma-54 dependent transcriptional regulator [Pseudohongiellaceae bacterium]